MNKLLTMALVTGMMSTVSFADTGKSVYPEGANYVVRYGPINADTEIQKGGTISIETNTSNERVLTIRGGLLQQ